MGYIVTTLKALRDHFRTPHKVSFTEQATGHDERMRMLYSFSGCSISVQLPQVTPGNCRQAFFLYG